MAPEQAAGAAVGPATDLYAVGVVLFEALTGRLPFSGDSPLAILYQHANAPAPALTDLAPNVSPALAAVVARALAKDPRDRYPSAEALRAALAGAGRGARSAEHGTGSAPVLVSNLRRSALPIALIAATVAVLFVLATLARAATHRTPARAAAPAAAPTATASPTDGVLAPVTAQPTATPAPPPAAPPPAAPATKSPPAAAPPAQAPAAPNDPPGKDKDKGKDNGKGKGR